jgi:uridine kinase
LNSLGVCSILCAWFEFWTMCDTRTTTQWFSSLATCLVRRWRESGTLLVGIDGRAGAGKSTFARNLIAALEEAGHLPALLRLDDCFFKTSGRRPIYFRDGDCLSEEDDYDYDWLRFRDQVLVPLRAHRTATFQKYDNRKKALAEWLEIESGGIVIVDGVSCTRRELESYYHFRIFIHAPRELSAVRAIQRDGEGVRTWYKVYWRPVEDHYMDVHRPETCADLVVDACGKRTS